MHFDINSQDLNQVSNCGGTLLQTALSDYNDWANLSFTGLLDADGALLDLPEIIDCDNPAPDN